LEDAYMSLNCLKRLNHGKKMVLKWLEIDKSLFNFTKKNESRNWFMGVATWRNLHNTTKPDILNALLLNCIKLRLPRNLL
jgi:hypothetical protein